MIPLMSKKDNEIEDVPKGAKVDDITVGDKVVN